MELVLNINEKRVDKIIKNIEESRSHCPIEHERDITDYWEHHLSKIKIEKIEQNKIRVTGESGFYFPGMTYSGLDLLNTLYKRFGLLKDISGTPFDLSIPQKQGCFFGYKIKGKWISSDFLRSIHHARKIIFASKNDSLNLPENLKILEIGSGTGIQALVFKKLYKKSTYYLVDFPETLALAQVFLSIVLPESKFLFFDDWQKNSNLLNGSDYDFVFIPNYAISQVPDNIIHLAINTVSMQEMNYQTIEMYFSELRRVLTEPSLFYQCNRDKKMDGVMIKLENYPYNPNDRHLFKRLDEFQQKTLVIRKCFGRIPVLRKIKIILFRTGTHISSLTKMSKR